MKAGKEKPNTSTITLANLLKSMNIILSRQHRMANDQECSTFKKNHLVVEDIWCKDERGKKHMTNSPQQHCISFETPGDALLVGLCLGLGYKQYCSMLCKVFHPRWKFGST